MDTDQRYISSKFEHVYNTVFIVDASREFALIRGLKLEKYERIFFVMDINAADIYKRGILEGLGLEEEDVFIHYVLPTESVKSIEYYPRLLKFLSDHEVGRYDAVVAVGGGVVIDLVGFTVSTYMRGLPFFVIATTLIGQTDASTAGKTCLNFASAKNLLGTFYYPEVVYNNIQVLSTCPQRITRQGLSEAFKYSLLTDGELLQDIAEYAGQPFDVGIMNRIVHKTIRSRIQVRQIDPLASNLGHTFGHALEKYFDYKILHGDAISIGTVMAIHYAVEKSLMKADECGRIVDMMYRARLNIWIDEKLDIHQFVRLMRKDKKSSARKLHLVMIHGIGKPYIGDSPFFESDYTEVETFLIKFMDRYNHKKENLISFLENEVLS